MPSAAAAQSSDVTFTIPLNLTQLSSQLQKVGILCRVTSSAFTRHDKGVAEGHLDNLPAEFPNETGRIVTTATVVVPIPFGSLSDDAAGKTASYSCTLYGNAKTETLPIPFAETATDPAHRLSPTPGSLSGTFTW